MSIGPNIAARWTDTTPWYNGPLVFGAALALEVMAIFSVATVLLRVRTRFYLWLLVTLICALIDLLFNAIDGLWPPNMVRDGFWCLLSWCGVCGFNVNNYARLRGLMANRHRHAKIALACLVAVPILLYTLYTIDTLYMNATGEDLPIGVLGYTSLMCDIWSVVDAVVSSILSACFVYLLQDKSRDGMELCHGYNDLLFHVKVMLSVEAVMILTFTAVGIASPAFDPLFLTLYFAEAFRYLIYSRFLNTLNSMLRKPRQLTFKSDRTDTSTVVATASEDGVIKLWTTATSSVDFTLSTSVSAATVTTALCFVSDTELIAAQDTAICSYGVQLDAAGRGARVQLQWQLDVASDEINDVCSAVAFAPDRAGRVMFSAGMDYRLLQWDVQNARKHKQRAVDIRTVLPSFSSQGSTTMYNPPMIMSMHTAQHPSASPRQTYVALGLGNGSVVVLRQRLPAPPSRPKARGTGAKPVPPPPSPATKCQCAQRIPQIAHRVAAPSTLFTVDAARWDAVEVAGLHQFLVSSVHLFGASWTSPCSIPEAQQDTLFLVSGSADQVIGVWSVDALFSAAEAPAGGECTLRRCGLVDAMQVPLKVNKLTVAVRPALRECALVVAGVQAQDEQEVLVYRFHSGLSM
ncbi:hypothetical protein RI367_005330 [Sorochytrium milnesiophthora]